uniref:Myb transcription factor n=1 Tax=Leersia perrieri TaxID=77586 RepID=A0A0D9WVC2_9ORYZ
MDFYSDDDDDSDAAFDEEFHNDMEAVRHSCIITGNDPDAAVAPVSDCLAADAPAAAADGSSDDDDEEEEDDLALVRSIRENLLLSKSSPSSPLTRPICAWPPSDSEDEDDDLETLRAIQRRFSHYHSGTSSGSEIEMKTDASKEWSVNLIANGPDEEIDLEKQNNKEAITRTGFPKAALLLVDALKKNRACQKFIRRKMINIEAKIEENKDLRDRVKCLLDYQLSCRKAFGKMLCQKEDPRVRLISSQKPCAQSSKNKDKKMPALFLGPADNPHVSKYKMVLKQFPMSLQKQPWSDVEKDKLAKGLKQQYQEALILNSMNNGSSAGDFSAVDMAYALTNTAGNFEVTPESLRSVLPLINWDKISAMYLPGRSGAECESRWLNWDDPLINHNAWTAREEKKLILIVQQRGMNNWINIAVALGTHRTPFQCLARYQRSLNHCILNKDWAKEEDLLLEAAVNTFGPNWQLVSASMDGRTGNQCSNRWRKTLNPERSRVGRWSLDEDKRLMVAVKLFGSGSWNKIAQFIPGRTQSQCNERWRNVLDPDIDLGEWRPEEDSKLLASVEEFGPCWSKIAGAKIPHRTDNMCLRRWRKLCQHKLPSVKAAQQIKKAIFQSNFVDRETERPAIAPSDLMSLVSSKVDASHENSASAQVKKPRKGSRIPCEDNILPSDTLNSSTPMNLSMDAEAAVNTTTSSSRKKPSRSRTKKQTDENLAVPDDANNSSNCSSGARKRKRSITDNNQVAQKKSGCSTSVDNEVGTKGKAGSTSVGEEGTAKKRRMRGSLSGKEGEVNKRMRGSVSGVHEGATKQRRGSVSTDNHGVVMKSKRAPSRKSAKESSTVDNKANEERDANTGNVNNVKHMSMPIPKQINMIEGSAQINGPTRVARHLYVSVRPVNNMVLSNGLSDDVSAIAVPTGPDPISVENSNTA